MTTRNCSDNETNRQPNRLTDPYLTFHLFISACKYPLYNTSVRGLNRTQHRSGTDRRIEKKFRVFSSAWKLSFKSNFKSILLWRYHVKKLLFGANDLHQKFNLSNSPGLGVDTSNLIVDETCQQFIDNVDNCSRQCTKILLEVRNKRGISSPHDMRCLQESWSVASNA